ncbi:MAG: hypothetical protein HY665_05705 [Chloroflexi bacterium]|nr:hypothetical protein [Chloroflexota bacterium]
MIGKSICREPCWEQRSTLMRPVDKEGHIVLTPKKLVDASQAYFWTEEWQKGERKADADIKAGRVKRFESAAAAVKYLEDRA